MGVGYNPKVATEGLAMCLDAANIKSYPGSGILWSDLTPKHNDGTLTNGPTFSNNSFLFDGLDDYVAVTSSALPDIAASGDVTQEAFVLLTSLPTSAAIIVKGRIDTSFNFGMTVGTTGTMSFLNTSGGTTVAGAGSVATGVWNHLAIVTNSSGSTGFVNGEQKLTAAGGVAATSTIKELSIGRISISGTAPSANYVNGNIALVRIYNRALSVDEVQRNFTALRTRFNI